MGTGVAQETGGPPGEPPDGAGAMESVEFESEISRRPPKS